MKICSKCNTKKDACEFHKKHDTKDGLYPLCKCCRSKQDKERNFNNKERTIKNCL